VQTKVDDVVLVIGFDPIQTMKRVVALLIADAAGFAVAQVDLDSGMREKTCRLPAQVHGTAVAAEKVRRGSSTMLAIVTVGQGSLWVHAVSWEDLAPEVDGNRVKTLNLGKALENLPQELYDQQAVTVTRMRAGSTDQQLALAWGVTKTELADGSCGAVKTLGSCKVALVGWGPSAEPAVLATATPDFASAPPDWNGYRLTAGDLLHNGTEQLVLGYGNNMPLPMNTNGTVLMLFTLDESAGPNLRYNSKYRLPFDDAPAKLSAGVFGTCLGVQAIVRSDDRHQLGCCFVPVDPNVGLPPGNESVPFTPVVPVTMDHACFAFPSDLRGQTLVLGAPRLEQKAGCGQILAIIQAPPFDRRVMATAPSVTFATSGGEGSGCSVSSDKTWTLSQDVSLSLGLGPLSLSQSIHNSYLTSLNQMNDSSSISNVQFHANFTDNDYLLVHEIAYNIWRYPVVRASVKNTVGELLVIFPQDSAVKTVWIPAHTYGYRPRSEVGMLLSYVDLQREAYTEENRLFSLQGIPVTDKADSAVITFDKSNSTNNADSRHLSVLNSASSHFSLAGNTELFDYLPGISGLPATFGLNLGSSHSYSDSSVQTTHLTVHSSMSLSVSGGAVNDPIYEYEITPYIYKHDRLGCLMLTWQVDLTGRAWHSAADGGDATLTSAQICLIRSVPQSKDPLYNSFSRSISFVENSDGTVDIVVEVFNNSLSPALNVSCEILLGKPQKRHDGVTMPIERLGKATLDGELKPAQRRSVTLARQKLTRPIAVTVRPFIGGIPSDYYWAVHPPEAFFA
jgi:hypothetical protein